MLKLLSIQTVALFLNVKISVVQIELNFGELFCHWTNSEILVALSFYYFIWIKRIFLLHLWTLLFIAVILLFGAFKCTYSHLQWSQWNFSTEWLTSRQHFPLFSLSQSNLEKILYIIFLSLSQSWGFKILTNILQTFDLVTIFKILFRSLEILLVTLIFITHPLKTRRCSNFHILHFYFYYDKILLIINNS